MLDSYRQAPPHREPATDGPARPAPADGRAEAPPPRPDDLDEVRIGPGVHNADLDDEIVLLHPADGSYFALNETGAYLWRQLGTAAVPRGAAVRRAAAAVTDRWLVEASEAERDLHELLDELLRRGLVVLAPQPA
ncbi:PqqD family protein [Pseudofrankia asymbiotica]|uniref:PqqD family protein n=1 Tax=Pseudofrankia asymbiotica TaxID=1834516 RepID=A0A1V2I291_9ACTN|nr:PqqD family protein [Pseudofrankia asymbiotica]ONH24007.1 hypothetical protein BL253_31395 [Pseudofrankia asymbiotica]